ncbi:MAG: cation:proton antiporter [Bdellovibrionota bacterium]
MITVSLVVTMVTGASPPEGGLGLVPSIALAVIAASAFAIVFRAVRQPPLLAYITTGLLLGIFVSPYIGISTHSMEQISHLGLVFLLFIIGLEMDIRGIFRLGRWTAAAILLQAPVAAAAAWLFQWGLAALDVWKPGLSPTPSARVYYAVAAAFGSTAVVVKLLADKFELGGQAGKVTVLTLIAEDVWAVAALSFLSASHTGGGEGAQGLVLMLGGGVALAAGTWAFVRFIFSKALDLLSHSPDVLSLVALGWCFLCAQAFEGIGLSAEMGALVAGLTLGPLPQSGEILGRVASLRDFFLALFFVALGLSLPVPTPEIFVGALILVAVTAASRLLLFAPSLLAAGQGPIVSFTSAVNLAQLSEFTLLILPVGLAGGAITLQDVSVISYALMLSVVLATYLINNNHALAVALERGLWMVSRSKTAGRGIAGAKGGVHAEPEIVLLGFFTNADGLARYLARERPEMLKHILVVDFNLKNHSKIAACGMRVLYGDVSNPDTLRHFGVDRARVIMSTISDAYLRGTSNADLLRKVRRINPQARFIGTAMTEEKRHELLEEGAFAAISPPDETAPAFLAAVERALEN